MRSTTKTLLITGASGFTGRHFIRYMAGLNENVKVVGIDICKGTLGKLKNYTFVKCNLLSKSKLERIIQDSCPDYILHCAGNISGGHTSSHKEELDATGNLLNAIVLNKSYIQPRILVVGSSAEYGIVSMERQPISEGSRLKPITTYGLIKAAQDEMAQQFYRDYGLDIVVARPFNIVGPEQPETLVCGSLVKQIVKISKNGPIRKDLVIGNMRTERDFVDIRDVVRAYWMLLKSKKKIAGEVFNIAGGRAYSIKTVLAILIKESGKKISVVQKKSRVRTADIPYQRADIRKIKKYTGWTPAISIESSLSDMLKTGLR